MIPPIICTRKCSIPRTRLPASRTTANASGSRSSSVSPSSRRFLNSLVFPLSSSSLNFCMSGRRLSIFSTRGMIRLTSRWLRVPNTFENIFILGFTPVYFFFIQALLPYNNCYWRNNFCSLRPQQTCQQHANITNAYYNTQYLYILTLSVMENNEFFMNKPRKLRSHQNLRYCSLRSQ